MHLEGVCAMLFLLSVCLDFSFKDTKTFLFCSPCHVFFLFLFFTPFDSRADQFASRDKLCHLFSLLLVLPSFAAVSMLFAVVSISDLR